MDSFVLEGKLRGLSVHSVLELCGGVDGSCWARCIHLSNNPSIQLANNHLGTHWRYFNPSETSQLELHEIPGKIFGPVDF